MVIEAQESSIERLTSAMAGMMAETRSEAGCLTYTYSRDLEVENRFHLCEIWETSELMEAHIDAAHSVRFVAILNELAQIRAVKAFGGDVEKVRIRAPAS